MTDLNSVSAETNSPSMSKTDGFLIHIHILYILDNIVSTEMWRIGSNQSLCSSKDLCPSVFKHQEDRLILSY